MPVVHAHNPCYLFGKLRLGGSKFVASLDKKKNLFQLIAGGSGTHLSSQATQKTEIGKFKDPGQPRQKSLQNPHINMCVVTCIHHLRDSRKYKL
jgi:hypothetical protein